jgi:hypothetical protein
MIDCAFREENRNLVAKNITSIFGWAVVHCRRAFKTLWPWKRKATDCSFCLAVISTAIQNLLVNIALYFVIQVSSCFINRNHKKYHSDTLTLTLVLNQMIIILPSNTSYSMILLHFWNQHTNWLKNIIIWLN